MSVSTLPLVNAVLNSLSTLLLVAGWVLIRKKRILPHRIVMLSALASSTAFLVSYLVYHAQVGSVHFTGVGTVRIVYFSILISHTLLAAAVPPLAVISLVRGLRGKYERHRKIARWTLPIWLYVSVTGVLVYLMLYVLYPSGGNHPL
jgi:uncharacterized membrane protein YozB (DUF420 family)